jgi:hypothetical protein
MAAWELGSANQAHVICTLPDIYGAYDESGDTRRRTRHAIG